MHCRTCDYALWNLTTRICPECGSAFLPSEFEFVPSSVAFCCPGCDQPYYGLGEKGHLIPRSFECVKCNEQIDIDDMVLRPAEGVDEKRTKVETVAWLERSKNGFWKSWFKTVIQSMVKPTILGTVVQDHDRIGAAWGFAFFTFLLIFLSGALTAGAFFALIAGFSGGQARVSFLVIGLFIVGMVSLALTIVGMIIWGLVTHAMLKITGGAPRSLSRTFEGICYSTGVLSLMAVPVLNLCILQNIALIWWVVAAILIVWKAQGVHGGRAALAVLVFPVICIVLFVGGYFGLIFWSIGMSTRLPPPQMTTWMNDRSDAQAIATAILDHAASNNGTPPAHVLELVLSDGSITTSSFVGSFSQTTLRDVKLVGDDTIEDLEYGTYTEKQDMVSALAKSVQSETAAYRVGDYVFTYPGIDLSQTRGLWIFIMCDDPDVIADQGTFPTIDPVWVGLDDGTLKRFPRPGVSSRLQQQNALRQQYGLQPLPDPLTLGHDTRNRDE